MKMWKVYDDNNNDNVNDYDDGQRNPHIFDQKISPDLKATNLVSSILQ